MTGNISILHCRWFSSEIHHAPSRSQPLSFKLSTSGTPHARRMHLSSVRGTSEWEIALFFSQFSTYRSSTNQESSPNGEGTVSDWECVILTPLDVRVLQPSLYELMYAIKHCKYIADAGRWIRRGHHYYSSSGSDRSTENFSSCSVQNSWNVLPLLITSRTDRVPFSVCSDC